MMKPSPFRRTKGIPREALESCRDGINAYNARSLSTVSFVAVFFLAACSLVPLLVEKDRRQFFCYLAACTSVLVIHFCSRWTGRRKKHSPSVFYVLFTLFFAVLMALGFYLGVFLHPDRNAVMGLLFMLCSQALFVVDLRYSVLLNFLVLAFFSRAIMVLKTEDIRAIGVVQVWVASALALALNRYIRYVVIKEMISAMRLENERDRFREESTKDELTGLSNRREYQSAANYYISVCQHVHQTVCAIMLDVDFFKNYNDYYGHQKGDEALKAIGNVLKRLVTEEQVFAARVGGEEFIVLWTENRIAEAERVAIKLNHAIAALRIPHEKSEVAPWVTASEGVYVLRGGSRDTEEDLYREADKALYEAKAQGRNCIMLRDSADRSLRRVELLPPEKNIGRPAR